MRSATIVVCGHVTLDRFGDSLVPGGTAYYAARSLAAMGARPLVLTAAGGDFPGSALAGIEAEVVAAPHTTTFEARYGPGGRSQRVLAAAPPLDLSRIPASWRGADALLVAPVLGECAPAEAAAAVGARIVGACIQGLVREVAPDGEVGPRLLDTGVGLEGVHVAFLGDDDVRGQEDLALRLSSAVPTVVFTHGARGCDLLERGRLWRVGAHPAREVDPTGAGDVFAAAFLLALAGGEDAPAAARLGAAAASIAVEGRGAEALARAAEAFGRAASIAVEPA